jgi:hypothetical protein
MLKGKCHEIFTSGFFFTKLLLLVPLETILFFYRLFVKIFNNFDALWNALPVPLTLVSKLLSGVNDTGK